MLFFSKMQATGNDFIIINYLDNKFEYSFKLLTKYLCDRHYGIGADGILILDKSNNADFFMRIFNQDGTEAEMCGNGIRCFSKYLYEKKITNKKELKIETKSGIKNIKLNVEGNTVISISVDMGNPILEFDKIPVFAENKENEKLHIEGFDVYPISMGNPHAVIVVDDLKNVNVEKYGKIVENYKYFPNKTNVEFVQIIDKNKLKVKVWERGAGQTQSCGTGACASAVISNLKFNTSNEIYIDLLGGKLLVKYSKEKNKVTLVGGAEFVFDGKIEI